MQTTTGRITFTLIILWLGHFLVDFMLGVWPVYKTMVGLDLAYAGLISSIAAFFGEGMQIVFGPMSDRGHQKKLIICGIFAASACAFVAYTTHYFALFLLFFVTCLGSAAFHPAAVGIVDALTVKRKGLFITLFASGGSMGLAFSQLIFSEFYLWSGNYTALITLPALLLIAVLCVYRLVTPSTPKKTAHSPVNLKTLLGLLKHPTLRLLYLAQVGNLALYWALIFFLPDVLLERHYESWICFGGAHLCLILGAAFMMIPGGYLADRYPPTTVLMISTSAAFILVMSFLGITTLSPAILLVIMFLLGATLGLLNPVIISYGTRLMPQSPGTIGAFLMGFAWCVSEGIGQGGGGLISKLFDEQAPAKALAILALNLIGCLYCFVKLARSRKSLETPCSN